VVADPARVRLTLAQAFGVLLSLAGVLSSCCTATDHAEEHRLQQGRPHLHRGAGIFALYSVLSLKRPAIHGLSFVAFTFGCGAACLSRCSSGNCRRGPLMAINGANLLTLFYVAVFPSRWLSLFQSRLQLIGANRAAPFFHVVPVFEP